MKHLKQYQDYNKVDEGLKENIIGGLLSILLGFGSVSAQNIHHRAKRTYSNQEDSTQVLKSERDINRMIKLGWTKSKEEIDTLWQEVKDKSPNTEIECIKLQINDSQSFASGEFITSDDTKSKIDSILDIILQENSILSKINIVSSTDKQGIGQNLKKK